MSYKKLEIVSCSGHTVNDDNLVLRMTSVIDM